MRTYALDVDKGNGYYGNEVYIYMDIHYSVGSGKLESKSFSSTSDRKLNFYL